MVDTLSTLVDVTPFFCQTQLTFTEFNVRLTQLMQRDEQLADAVLAFTDEEFLQNTVKLLTATKQILGEDFVDQVIAGGALPVGQQDFKTFYDAVLIKLDQLTQQTTITVDEDPRSLKSVVAGNQATLAALSEAVIAFKEELAAISDVIDDIAGVKTTVDQLDDRVTTLEALMGDVTNELKNARKEFASDPSKRLVDKIDAMDSVSAGLKSRLTAVVKELTDARAAERFDTLAERLGSIEADLEALQNTLENLRGKGSVTAMKVGRSMLHGAVELIPGSNIAITRERNGYRIDVVDIGTVVDLAAQKVDPNNCCGPGTANFAN